MRGRRNLRRARAIASAYAPRRTKRYPDGIPINSAEDIELEELIESGAVRIRNCSNATHISPLGIDVQAIPLFRKIALALQLTGEFPAKVSYAKWPQEEMPAQHVVHHCVVNSVDQVLVAVEGYHPPTSHRGRARTP